MRRGWWVWLVIIALPFLLLYLFLWLCIYWPQEATRLQ